MTDDELTETIEENLAGPKKVTGDTGSVEQHSIPDQIAADKYLKTKEATRAGVGIGARYFKFVPPGTT